MNKFVIFRFQNALGTLQTMTSIQIALIVHAVILNVDVFISHLRLLPGSCECFLLSLAVLPKLLTWHWLFFHGMFGLLEQINDNDDDER